jgi:hypothetical protein
VKADSKQSNPPANSAGLYRKQERTAKEHEALGFTQPLTEMSTTEMSTRSIKIIIMFLGSKVHWVLRADNFTAIYEPIV